MSIAAWRPARSAGLPHTAAEAGVPPVEAAGTAAPRLVYVGLATRAIAFVLDAALINAAAIIAAAGAGLAASLLHLPHDIAAAAAAAGGCLYVLWSIGYFVAFWSTTGQTPGNRVMGIRVCTARGDPVLPRRALIRCLALPLAALPLGAGYLMILVEDRRRGLQDVLGRTVVVEYEDPDSARARRRRPSARERPG